MRRRLGSWRTRGAARGCIQITFLRSRRRPGRRDPSGGTTPCESGRWSAQRRTWRRLPKDPEQGFDGAPEAPRRGTRPRRRSRRLPCWTSRPRRRLPKSCRRRWRLRPRLEGRRPRVARHMPPGIQRRRREARPRDLRSLRRQSLTGSAHRQSRPEVQSRRGGLPEVGTLLVAGRDPIACGAVSGAGNRSMETWGTASGRLARGALGA